MKSRIYTDKHAVGGLKEKLPVIEVFPNQYPNYEIKVEMPEFTSICPRTGLPDFGVISIRYIPKDWVAELKALKLYLNGYRNMGIFQENATNRILRDFTAAVGPVFCEVVGDFAARGGLTTKVTARYGQEPSLGIHNGQLLSKKS
ncbi:MAG: NADPH-dependent 7-cyano-7-deazaguanine reductase QueF [Elusimicrobia bacterium]|nr:NADPH-dependent 7-cyano-7-deazaguanine reductase QueF [Elusimicrobiota bacterium]